MIFCSMQLLIKKVGKWESAKVSKALSHFPTFPLSHFLSIRYYYLYIFSLLILAGCKKNYPVVQPPAKPEFTFYGTIAGEGVTMEAGNNDYYMFTSFALDANGVYEYKGEMKNKNCSSNCPRSL